MSSSKRAIFFVAWGAKAIQEVQDCMKSPAFPSYPVFLATSDPDLVPSDSRIRVIPVEFRHDGLLRKAEGLKHLPDGYDSILFLDTDTAVLDDIELGFQKAEQHGLALAFAPYYDVTAFQKFARIREVEGVPSLGHPYYNSGVLFIRPDVQWDRLLSEWLALIERHHQSSGNDQPYLSFAIELTGTCPYVLTHSFCYRAFMDPIHGPIRIWHSREPIPENINSNLHRNPRRNYVLGKVTYPGSTDRSRVGWFIIRMIRRLAVSAESRFPGSKSV